MHTLKIVVAMLGLLILTNGCSSDRDDAKPLELRKTGSDAAFTFYDLNRDLYISAEDLYAIEKDCPGSLVTSRARAIQIMADYDMDGDGLLDSVEFNGMANAKVLAGFHRHPEWTRRSQSR